MDGIPKPSPEREKEFQLLREKSEEIGKVIRESIGETTSIFDLCCFSAFTLLQAVMLFPNEAQSFRNVIRDCVTMSMDSKIAIEDGSEKIEVKDKKSGLIDPYGNPL